ncbi:hypothetical protein CKO38_14495 [Rhodospirillum rubrum]|uniref:hypothetical protein n=1 Tax=Rhodospirillum rubrum TaxID=1085 RepID=UPI001906DA72|nr:hypothetical protein [Rhodospirillum rubrum]MBK1665772.1 hypothetical protein [Rhodospirillum rubrum]MBK1677855.1 hypothetical protein [Rhodospirillum rubrum]
MTGRHYCTYFDHRYLPRGLVLMDSIHKFDPEAIFHILAFDDTCADTLEQIGDEHIEVTTLKDLETFDQDLYAVKSTRSLIEYYFTSTPCFPRYVLNKFPDLDMITYIDSDTFFYSDPEIIFDDIGPASVAITPHRFSPERENLAVYGRFNVGWITWRNDDEGRRCLEDYRRDCLEWCYDRLEPSRFADQKYLDKWPALYPSLKSLENPGVNAASWNINGCVLSEVDGLLFLNDRRLVFWHYHGLKEGPDGAWTHALDAEQLARHPALIDRIYRPYIKRLRLADQLLKVRYGLERQVAVHIRYSADRPSAMAGSEGEAAAAPPFQGWRTVSAGWPTTPPAGWMNPGIVEVRRDQWQALTRTPPIDSAGASPAEQLNTLVVLDAFDEALRRRGADKPLRILDWGGDVGMMRQRLSHLRPQVEMLYTVKEMPQLCELGRALNPAVRFVDDDQQALAQGYDLVIASASMHYDKAWQKTLAGLSAATEGVLLIARQPTLSTEASFVAEQGAYDSVFTCWILNEADLLGQFDACGLVVARRLFSGDGAGIDQAAEQPVFRSYLLRKRSSRKDEGDDGEV